VPAEPPAAPRDPARELAMKISAPFTLAAVGDVMIKRPASMLEDATFQSAIRILRDADIATGNMEGNLSDLPRFDGPLRGMMGSKEVAPDLKLMGFDMMNRANNHIFDSDKDGMFATIEQLDAAGIVHAGTGKNLEDARAPAYLDTPKGRIAIVGMHPRTTPQALPRRATPRETSAAAPG
jgi:poly-gamma-glutamate synthesis protein (capsule biosynthesis protein)